MVGQKGLGFSKVSPGVFPIQLAPILRVKQGRAGQGRQRPRAGQGQARG